MRRYWMIAAGVLVAATALVLWFAPGSVLAGILILVTLVFVLPVVFLAARALWRRLTYRVGRKLFLSYLLIGVVPFLCCFVLGGYGLYMLAGQYSSVRLSTEMRQLAYELDRTCSQAAEAYRERGMGAAFAAMDKGAGQTRLAVPQVIWLARYGDREVRSRGADNLPVPLWLASEPFGGPVFHDGDPYFLVGHAEPGAVVAALVRLDDATARALNRQLFFDVYFLPAIDATEDNADVVVRSLPGANSERLVLMNSEPAAAANVWEHRPGQDQHILDRPWIFWFRANMNVRDLATGEPLDDLIFLSLLRTSPRAAWQDFTRSRYRLGAHIVISLGAGAAVLMLFYGFALAVAGKAILSITQATSRLTRGARAVERGELDHRIPVKRRDQLGDLALAFNRMTEAVQGMLADVAEKERLGRELELAREIQMSLLPDCHLDHEGLALHSEFRPAAAVGGDYFDLFLLEGERLILTVGDVAGHGLHTGLLMAALKSSVAAMVHEGYGGSELLLRVNDLLQHQVRGRFMTTISLVEIDLGHDLVRVTNAGHPPPLLMAGSAPVELLAPSLPLGSAQCTPAVLEHPFASGDRLVLYTDGLVESTNAGGEPYGYQALARVLHDHPDLGGAALASAVMTCFDSYTAGVPLEDDLTLLVLDRLK